MKNNKQQSNKKKCHSGLDPESKVEKFQNSKTQQKPETVVSVKNVSKVFKVPHKKIDTLRGVFVNMGKGMTTCEEFKALDNVSFEVKRGEFFGIIGRNGSGKSTMLKILAGVYAQDKGDVEINGLISPFLELGIGFNPELSGRDNIYLNATVLGLTKKEIDEKFDEIVKFAELEKFIDQQLKNYSSGMQVRLAFSVSIHANRDILLMDEVLAVGDANFQKKCIKIFEGYSDTNRTVILVTHDIGAVRKYCDRAMLLHNGKMLKVGDVDEVCDEYVMKNMTAEARAELEETEEMKKEEKQREKNLKKQVNQNKIAEIVDVQILDINDKEKDVFESFDDIVISFKFKVNEPSNLHFGVGVAGADCTSIMGLQTFNYNKRDIDKIIKQGHFKVLFKKVPLNVGVYEVHVAIWGSNINDIVDYMPRISKFKINNKGVVNEGIISLETDIIIK